VPAPDGTVDLRSDTVTRPTPAMRRAMADAEVGDDQYGEDPTVNRLQERTAGLFGTEAALLTPTGTMANQLALVVLGRRGTEVLCPARSHIRSFEAAAAAAVNALQVHPLADDAGRVDPGAIDAAVADSHHHLAPISMVTIENTHMASGGRAVDVVDVEAVRDACDRAGLPLYCDGARIWNAAVALEVPIADLVRPVRAIMSCFSKGLGAPVGSILCGPSDLIAAAADWRGRFGGAMRQSGVIAAAALVGLDTMVDRLADDHARARRLADAIAERWPGSTDPADVDTNIVCASLAALPDAFIERLEHQGIRTGHLGAATVRLVTHCDVDDDDLRRAVDALDALV
jgi:threonine aldolase